MTTFLPGDLVACGPKKKPQFGIILRVNGKPTDDTYELVVCWGDIDGVKGYTSDEYPDEVRFITHITGAEILEERHEAEYQAFLSRESERHDMLMAALEKLEKKLP